jgi:hypothetical protein
MVGNDLWVVAVLITLVACSGKHRPFADGSAGSGGIGDSAGAAGTTQALPGSSEVGEGMGFAAGPGGANCDRVNSVHRRDERPGNDLL